MQPSTLAKRGSNFLFLGIIGFYFYGLGRLPFVGPDEPRYAQVAREMFLRGDLITPTLGGHTWFEKPALLYWIMIASYSLFGVSEWAARLGPAICGLLTIAAVYWLGKRVERTSPEEKPDSLGFWSALITASTAGMIVFSRGVNFDILLTMTTTWALSLFLAAELEQENQPRLLLSGFYVFIGLSLLAKGLVGIFIPFGIIGTYYGLRRKLPPRRLWSTLIWGLPLALAVSATWYSPVIARHGWIFIDEFFIQHHFARYVSNKYHHPQPIYYYLVTIIPLSLPWTAFLIGGLAQTRSWQWRGENPQHKFRVFAFSWVLLPVVFFSFSNSKLPGYILPVLPATALIAGERLAAFLSNREPTWPLRISAALLLGLAAAGFYYAEHSGNISLRAALIILAPLIVAGLFALFAMRLRTTAALLIVCASLVAFVLTLHFGLAEIARQESTRDLIRLAASRGYGSAPVYALHKIDRTAEFYAAGRVVYGPDGEPLRFESAAQVVAAARQTKGPILVIVPAKYVEQLLGLKSAQTEVVGVNGEVALVAVSVG